MTSLGKGQVGGLLETDLVNESWVQEMLKSYTPTSRRVDVKRKVLAEISAASNGTQDGIERLLAL